MPRKCDCREAARRLADMGFSAAEIAKIFGVSPRAVRYWLSASRREGARPKLMDAAPAALIDNEWVKILRGKA
ncbi:helix-turn-helix domain-containing protein [Pyrobaculum sp.]|uniref:helix-turn-helix domain-containing protein n=1 Tax=Pyrobaculum sp. TaxID=2004705 RepID=UPI00316A1640